MRYDVYDATTGVLIHENIDADECERVTLVDARETEWAIEEEGRCDTDDTIVVPHGSRRPKR